MASGGGSGHIHREKNVVHIHHEPVTIAAASSTSNANSSSAAPTATVVSRKTLQTLGKEVDPNVLIDEETEDMLLGYSDEFLEQLIDGACKLAAHRKATSLDVADIELYLERHCNMWISSDPKEEPTKPPKKISPAEAHRQRMALIKKTLKKY